jgi:hypothetical protein
VPKSPDVRRGALKVASVEDEMPMHEVDSLGFEAHDPVGLPARANLPNDTSPGPEVGQRLPDLELRYHTGRWVSFHEDRGN